MLKMTSGKLQELDSELAVSIQPFHILLIKFLRTSFTEMLIYDISINSLSLSNLGVTMFCLSEVM